MTTASPYRMHSLQELRERQEKLSAVSPEQMEQRRILASSIGLSHGRWRKHFEQAWTTLIMAKPTGDAQELAERAKSLADAAFAITEPLRREVDRQADRVFYEGEVP